MSVVGRYFDRHAAAFDRVYEDRRLLAPPMRGGPARGRDLAVAEVARRISPAVLDVGCGPGRVGEAVMAAGAASYVGIDASERMLDLAQRRLRGFDAVALLHGDFLELRLDRSFDVVLALGVFDYLDEPVAAARWLHERCASVLLASFTRWDLLKAPIRHLHYAAHRCRVYDYAETEVDAILRQAGFARAEVVSAHRRGFLVRARPASSPFAMDHEDRTRPANAAR